MLAVRYVALVALVVWIGATTDVLVGDALGPVDRVAAVCGGIVFVSLFVMKFIGPPPHGFVPRAAIVGAMLVLLGVSRFLRVAPAALATVNVALGFILLFWYVRE
jgi:hypothetical protein